MSQPSVITSDKFLSPEVVFRLVTCGCDRCVSLRKATGFEAHARKATASKSILGGYGSSRSQSRSSILILALLLYIDSPALVFGFITKGCTDQDLENRLEDFSGEYLQREFWPVLSSREPSLSQAPANKFRWSKYKFVVPVISDEEFSVYPDSAILPFVNEIQIGRTAPNGSVVSEGAYGHVYSFKILDEYRAFPVSQTLVIW
jgi:hypothetical protein